MEYTFLSFSSGACLSCRVNILIGDENDIRSQNISNNGTDLEYSDLRVRMVTELEW